MKKAYLKNVQISGGLFSNESSIRVTDYQGDEYSGFFQNTHIQKGMLEGMVLDKKDNLVLFRLPGRLLEGKASAGSGNTITVYEKDIVFSDEN